MSIMNCTIKSLALASLAALAVAGCGSSINPDAGDNTSFTQHSGAPTKAGLEKCALCHAEINAKFKASAKIAQTGAVTPADPACKSCHDPDSDASRVQAAYGFAALGGAVGCEACHGAGSQHMGIGAIPVPNPAPSACKGCHETPAPGHLAARPVGAGAWAAYASSAHYSSNAGMTASAAPACSRCHTHQGEMKYRAVEATWASLSGADGYFTTGAGAAHAPIANSDPVSCPSCHDPHGGLREAASASGSAQFNTCVSCHTLSDAFHGGANAASWTSTGASDTFTFTGGSRVISDTHVSAASDALSSQGLIAGYVVKAGSPDACTSCHDRHGDDLTISLQWARSAYGGALLKNKEAVENAPVTVGAGQNPADAGTVPASFTAGTVSDGKLGGPIGSTWAVNDWDATLNADGSPKFGQCQICHTATGFRNYVDAKASSNPYDFRDNDFSHLKGWHKASAGTPTASSPQNELMFCWACHDGDLKTLNPGAVAISYYPDAFATAPVDYATLPDLGRSNLCVRCHIGRGNMENLVNLAAEGQNPAPAAALVPGLQFSPTVAHNYASTAILYQKLSDVAYKYYQGAGPGGDSMYDDLAPQPSHSLITGALIGSEIAGPCVTCHMGGAAGHTFTAITKDEGGNTVINNSSQCAQCHFKMNPAILDERKAGYANALAALKARLETATGATYERNLDRYFYSAPGQPFTGWADMGELGAAHNLVLLDHEQGSYVHNAFFAKRLVVDSIDWLDNGVMDGTITLDAAAYAKALAWLGGNAVTGVVTRF